MCGNVRSRGGLVSVCVHRCRFSASERRQAEKLTLRLRVVIDCFRRLYCDDISTGPLLETTILQTQYEGIPSHSGGTQTDLLSNSSEGFLIPTHGFCFRLDSRARQTPPLSG